MLRWISELGSKAKGILIDTDAPPSKPSPPLPVVIEHVTRRGATREELEEPPEEEGSNGEPLTLKWWYAYQNNPMGVDDYFPEKGVGQYVCFEDFTKDDADSRFQDSVRPTSSSECDCCGPRWDWELDGSGTPEPTIYDTPVREYLEDNTYSVGRSIFLHYWDGSIVELITRRENK